MKKTVAAALATLWFATACGKTADPRPPFIRIPEPVTDLSAVQDGYRIVLSWTNPPHYIDGSAATDLSIVHLLRNGGGSQTIPVTAAGKKQSYEIDAAGLVGMPQTFSVDVETRRGKMSAHSNPVSISPVEVPGPVRNLTAVVDQLQIHLEWQVPERNGALAEAYMVQRQNDPSGPHVVTTTQYDDAVFTPGQPYVYSVIAVRGREARIPGVPAPPLSVRAVDTTAPKSPTGLRIVLPNPPGAFLTWDENGELDLAGYRVFRSDRPDSGFTLLEQEVHVASKFFDPTYQAGLYYAVSAVDGSGNESPKSAVLRAP